MLNIQEVNHIGIRIRENTRSISFYQLLGFQFASDVVFEEGHPIIMKHPSGVVLNLLGPANGAFQANILMDSEEKNTGITHFALTVESLEETKDYLAANNIALTGSFSFGGMSAVFIRDPDRNVIELDSYSPDCRQDMTEYEGHL